MREVVIKTINDCIISNNNTHYQNDISNWKSEECGIMSERKDNKLTKMYDIIYSKSKLVSK